MKKILIILFLCPLSAFTQIQSDTTFNSKSETISINQKGINDLVNRYKNQLKNTGGIKGWTVQIKFTSKRGDIIPYQVRFTNLYPEVPTQIIFSSPYYRLTVGNFRTRNEALKMKDKISIHFPGAHHTASIIDPDLLKN